MIPGCKVALLASGAVLFLSVPAFAQTSMPATPPASTTTPPGNPSDASGAVAASQPTGDGTQSSTGTRTGLEEIVVTATRRTVDLQRVTATVEAVPANTLKAYNITAVTQLPSLVSGLVVTSSGGNNVYLRGIGSPSTGFNEAQTATYIDGLYLANPTAGITSFNNVDRIEVLKGPQGTLYGRNVTGGLISVTTRDPSEKPRVDASIGYGNYDTLTANLYGSAPVTDNLAVNVAVFHQKQGKGWSTNLFTGADVQKLTETGVEAKAQWRPHEGLKITASFIYDYNNRNTGYAAEVYPGTLGNDGTPYLGRYRFVSRLDPSAPTKLYVGTLKVEQDLGFATLMGLTGYQTSTALVTFPGGLPNLGQPFAGQSGTYINFFEHNKTFSQEFQLTSKPSSSRFDWVAGAFYYDDHTELRLDTYNTCVNNVCAPNFIPTSNDGYPSTLSGSVYGDGTYRFFKATRLTVGLRYTDERKTLSGQVYSLPGHPNSAPLGPAATATTAGGVYYPGQPFPGFPNGIPTRLHFDRLTYRAVLAQDIGEDLHVYASHNLGFKSGAFNGNVFSNPPVQPELLYATEAGVKSELFNRTLRLNLSYFHYIYKNVQLRSLAPPATPANPFLQNVASEHLDGVDGDFTVVPFRGLTINGSFEYLNGKYADYPGASCITANTKANPNSATAAAMPLVEAPIVTTCNLGGTRIPQAPPVSASLGATYRFDTDVGAFSFSGNDHYTSRYLLYQGADIYQSPHHIIDLSLSWVSVDKHYDVNLFVRNLTKQYTFGSSIVSTSYSVTPGAPRTFGATVGFHY